MQKIKKFPPPGGFLPKVLSGNKLYEIQEPIKMKLLRAGVMFFVNTLQSNTGDVRIYLRGRNV